MGGHLSTFRDNYAMKVIFTKQKPKMNTVNKVKFAVLIMTAKVNL